MQRRPCAARVRRVNPPRRFALLFGAQFLGFGAMLPFLPAILAEGGLTPEQVGTVLAAGAMVRLVAGPLSGRLADQVADMRRLLAFTCLLAALAAVGFGLLAGFALLLAVQLLHSAAAAPIIPLSDSQAAGAVRAGGFDYARVRAWGSITFIIGAVAAGQATEWAGPRAVAWILAGAMVLTALSALALPPPGPRRAAPRGGLWAPLREPLFRRVLLVSALIQASHAAYYAFSTLHWQAAGLSAGFIGVLWGVGVVAEVLLFLRGGRLVDRLGLRALVAIAAGAGVLRWGLTAVTADPIALLLLQTLHAATFGVMHLAAMRAMVRLPAELSGRAQTLLSAGVSATMGVVMWLSGQVFAALGGLVFLSMAAMCAAALLALLAWQRD
nr:MFS transporter [Roseococcus thiosulfatophilus]